MPRLDRREVRLWLDGQPPRKSNQRRIFKAGDRPILVKSQQAIDWVSSVLKSVPEKAKLQLGSAEPRRWVKAWFLVFYRDNRSDLSIELVLDALQKAGVLNDDRYVFQCTAIKALSKTVQGVYCILTEYEQDWMENSASQLDSIDSFVQDETLTEKLVESGCLDFLKVK